VFKGVAMPGATGRPLHQPILRYTSSGRH